MGALRTERVQDALLARAGQLLLVRSLPRLVLILESLFVAARHRLG